MGRCKIVGNYEVLKSLVYCFANLHVVILFKKSQNLIFLVFCICSHVFCHKVVKSFICSLGLVMYGIYFDTTNLIACGP